MTDSKITEKDLLINFEALEKELKEYSASDPSLKEYEKETEGLKEKKPFSIIPTSFIYEISPSL
jgi:hypothetical protein